MHMHMHMHVRDTRSGFSATKVRVVPGRFLAFYFFLSFFIGARRPRRDAQRTSADPRLLHSTSGEAWVLRGRRSYGLELTWAAWVKCQQLRQTAVASSSHGAHASIGPGSIHVRASPDALKRSPKTRPIKRFNLRKLPKWSSMLTCKAVAVAGLQARAPFPSASDV